MNADSLGGAPPQDDVYVIPDLETLKLFSDPLRLSVLNALIDGPHTVKEVGATLGVRPVKLYYHFRLLEAHGLIRVVSTRMVSGILEKTYQSRARRFSVERSQFTFPLSLSTQDLIATADGVLTVNLDGVRSEVQRSIQSGALDPLARSSGVRSLTVRRAEGWYTPEQIVRFNERITALQREFREASSDAPDAAPYIYLQIMYPLAREAPEDAQPPTKDPHDT